MGCPDFDGGRKLDFAAIVRGLTLFRWGDAPLSTDCAKEAQPSAHGDNATATVRAAQELIGA